MSQNEKITLFLEIPDIFLSGGGKTACNFTGDIKAQK
jgi:hypothetical protein